MALFGMSDDQFEQTRDYLDSIRTMIQHENDLTNSRFNWLLVGEGIFFTAAASFWGEHPLMLIVVALVGIVSAVSIYYSLELCARARNHFRKLAKNKAQAFSDDESAFAPVVGDDPTIRGYSFLNPWKLVPQCVVIAWVILIILRLLDL